jgi:hypothetical protein
VLGACINELRRLTNLSLDFRYFKNYFVEFTKLFCEVPAAFWFELFDVTFCFFIFVVWRSAKDAESFLHEKFNRSRQVSDQGLSALAAGIKELSILTNLSLDFGYFN